MSQKGPQGAFHLLSIVFVPLIVVSLFMTERYWIPGSLVAIFISILLYLFKYRS